MDSYLNDTTRFTVKTERRTFYLSFEHDWIKTGSTDGNLEYRSVVLCILRDSPNGTPFAGVAVKNLEDKDNVELAFRLALKRAAAAWGNPDNVLTGSTKKSVTKDLFNRWKTATEVCHAYRLMIWHQTHPDPVPEPEIAS